MAQEWTYHMHRIACLCANRTWLSLPLKVERTCEEIAEVWVHRKSLQAQALCAKQPSGTSPLATRKVSLGGSFIGLRLMHFINPNPWLRQAVVRKTNETKKKHTFQGELPGFVFLTAASKNYRKDRRSSTKK